MVLLEDFTGSKETRVNLPQSCVLALFRDHSWLGHNTNSKERKALHRAALSVSVIAMAGGTALAAAIQSDKLKKSTFKEIGKWRSNLLTTSALNFLKHDWLVI